MMFNFLLGLSLGIFIGLVVTLFLKHGASVKLLC